MKNAVCIISPRNNRPSSDEMVKMIKSTKGKFFSCVTLKSDGSYRKWVARTGVKKGVKGIGRKNTKENLVTVFDMQINQFRTLDTNKLLSFKCGGIYLQHQIMLSKLLGVDYVVNEKGVGDEIFK